MQVTAAKLAANQSNSLSSTGPLTPEGKARSSKNALRRGLSSLDLTGEVQPQGVLEMEAFNRLLLAAWNLQRLRRLMAACQSGDGIDPLQDEQPNPGTARPRDCLLPPGRRILKRPCESQLSYSSRWWPRRRRSLLMR